MCLSNRETEGIWNVHDQTCEMLFLLCLSVDLQVRFLQDAGTLDFLAIYSPGVALPLCWRHHKWCKQLLLRYLVSEYSRPNTFIVKAGFCLSPAFYYVINKCFISVFNDWLMNIPQALTFGFSFSNCLID